MRGRISKVDRVGANLFAVSAARGTSFWLSSLFVAVTTGCGSGRIAVESAGGPPTVVPAAVPAGVDSTVASYADSLADVSFVGLEEQRESNRLLARGRILIAESDSIWSALEAYPDTTLTVTPQDSISADAAAQAGGRSLVALEQLLSSSDIDSLEIAAEAAVLLDSAEASLERAFRYNPYDSRSKLWLAQVYELQARRLGREASYERAIEELKKLAHLTPDEHVVYAWLANNYYYTGRWQLAAEGYRTAEEVYRATFGLEPAGTTASPDSAVLFQYARAQSDMHVRRGDAESAVVALERALTYATGPDMRESVHAELRWIQWDGGNLATVAARDSLADLEGRGMFRQASAGYEALLPQVTARAAKREVQWRMSIALYNAGIVARAAQELRRLVDEVSESQPGDGRTDTMHARYVSDFGTMCLSLGRTSLRDESDNRAALKYFEQAARLEWPGRPVANLEVATLVQANKEEAIRRAELARKEAHLLSLDQKKDLYRLLMLLYRRTADFEMARTYRDAYRRLEEG